MWNAARLVIVIAALAVAGCAGKGCGKPGKYHDARPGTQLQIPDGLDAPPTQRRVTVPPATDSVHPELRGDRVVGPDGKVRCLIEPPPLTEERRRARG